MTAEGAFTPDSDVDRIFGPIVHAQTYRNWLYSLLEFPLGILYFVSMMVGVSLGLGTLIIVVGFVVLAVTLAIARLFGRFEREVSKALLGAVFENRNPAPREWRALLRDRSTWLMVVYLVIRLPLGVAGLIAAVLMIAGALAMIAPLLCLLLPSNLNSEEAILVSLFGCVFFLGAAHLVNALAGLSRRLAVALL